MNQRCPCKTQLNLAKNQSQGLSTKNSSDEDFKTKELQPNNNFAGNMKPLKKVQKDKKWKMYLKKQEKRNGEDNTLTEANGANIRSNMANNDSQKKSKSQVIC